LPSAKKVFLGFRETSGRQKERAAGMSHPPLR